MFRYQEGNAEMKKILNFRVVVTGLLTALLLTAASLGAYFFYCSELRLMEDSPQAVEDAGAPPDQILENPDQQTLEYLLGFHYVLYKEAYANRLVQQGEESFISYQDLFFEEKSEPKGIARDSLEIYNDMVNNRRLSVNAYLLALEQSAFSEFNRQYDYWLQDLEAKDAKIITNVRSEDPGEIDLNSYAFLYQISYDQYGFPGITDFMTASDEEKLRKDINTVLHEDPVILFGGTQTEEYSEYDIEAAVEEATRMKNPSNCVITVGITKEKWKEAFAPEISDRDYYITVYRYFDGPEVNLFYWAMLLAACCAGALYLNPRSEEKRFVRNFPRVWPELLAVLVFFLVFAIEYEYNDMANSYWNDGALEPLVRALAQVFCFYLAAWYAGGCLGEVRILGLRGYLEQRSFIVKNWNRLQNIWKGVVRSYQEIDLGKDLRRKLLGLLIVNGLVILFFCCMWFAGIVGVVIYSAALYFLLLKYLNRVQKEFRTLQDMTREMAAGNLKYVPEDSDLKLFEPLRKDLVSIRDGFDKAVQEEVKSQRMKTELITNVSHDLKTPLTAIITYINLLKEKNLTEEQREKYLETLEKKSLRLKTLIEDLFEVSKANSGNVQLNLQSCDLVNLLKQVSLEMQDKLEEKHLITRMLLPEEKVVLQLDSEKTYRIYENLFANVAKYAMEKTRVYVGMLQDEQTVSVIIKNITESELSIEPEELTERFVRGDASRGSVEGSGLGLAIVRSFTELQGGKLEISIDGDLFKVTTTWKR